MRKTIQMTLFRSTYNTTFFIIIFWNFFHSWDWYWWNASTRIPNRNSIFNLNYFQFFVCCHENDFFAFCTCINPMYVFEIFTISDSIELWFDDFYYLQSNEIMPHVIIIIINSYTKCQLWAAIFVDIHYLDIFSHPEFAIINNNLWIETRNNF